MALPRGVLRWLQIDCARCLAPAIKAEYSRWRTVPADQRGPESTLQKENLSRRSSSHSARQRSLHVQSDSRPRCRIRGRCWELNFRWAADKGPARLARPEEY